MLKVGVRSGNEPGKIETEVLTDFVRRNFGDYTPENVNEAFELAITGKLDEDSKCYENFSCEYVGRILSSYKRYLKLSGRLKSNFEIERNYIEPLKQLTAAKMSNYEIIEMARGLFDTIKKVDLIYPDAYRALIETGEIKLTEIKQYQPYYMQQSEIRIKQYEEDDRCFFKNKDREEWKKIYARKLVVSDYFNGYLNEDQAFSSVKRLQNLIDTKDTVKRDVENISKSLTQPSGHVKGSCLTHTYDVQLFGNSEQFKL